jgi:heme/copper-type cytochrome/quinol oxidase subunit 3
MFRELAELRLLASQPDVVGNAGMMAIEGVAFGFMIIIYFYLRSIAETWPDDGGVPDLRWGTLNLSLIAAERMAELVHRRGRAQPRCRQGALGLIACAIVVTGLCVVRWFEFTALNARWDDGPTARSLGAARHPQLQSRDATTSTRSCCRGHVHQAARRQALRGHRENCGYWWFVVLTWIPIYAVVYWASASRVTRCASVRLIVAPLLALSIRAWLVDGELVVRARRHAGRAWRHVVFLAATVAAARLRVREWRRTAAPTRSCGTASWPASPWHRPPCPRSRSPRCGCRSG